MNKTRCPIKRPDNLSKQEIALLNLGVISGMLDQLKENTVFIVESIKILQEYTKHTEEELER